MPWSDTDINPRPWQANGFEQIADVKMDDELERRHNAHLALRQSAWREPVVLACGTDISLATPGAAPDGIVPPNPSRIMLLGQTIATQNGPHTWAGASVPLVRCPDSDSGAKLLRAIYPVLLGTYKGAVLEISNATTPNLGTDAITFQNYLQPSTSGLLIDLPAASVGNAGKIYIATDEGTIYQSDGSNWNLLAYTQYSTQMTFFGGMAQTRPAFIAAPTGGTVIDVQCRAQLDALLTLLQTLQFTTMPA